MLSIGAGIKNWPSAIIGALHKVDNGQCGPCVSVHCWGSAANDILATKKPTFLYL